jgi:Plasmid pRiA4b ORF-3-like protein
MMTPSDAALAAAAAAARPLRQVRAFTGWVGAGRKLTQTGRLTLADAGELVGLLGTGDAIDPKIGDRVFRTRSSEELPGITLVAEWAKASGVVRVTGGRLVQVKRHAGLLQRPLELWARMFEAFPRLGEALCPAGWGESLLRHDLEEAVGVVLAAMARGPVTSEEACTLAWETVAGDYVLDDLTDQQLAVLRELTDRDVRHALEVLQELDAVRGGAVGTVKLTELAWWALGRGSQGPAPGDPVFQLRVTLAGVADPAVWRRLLVPAATRLDRLHQMIQAAMGWENHHLHAFTDGRVRYGRSDPELRLRDERKATLGNLIPRKGGRARYTYDFGDHWEHELVVEERLAAESGTAYPVCVAGEGACPPEDCGGPWGYEHLREVLADPTSDEHEDMLAWLGLDKATDFDPHRFDLNRVNRAVILAGAAR